MPRRRALHRLRCRLIPVRRPAIELASACMVAVFIVACDAPQSAPPNAKTADSRVFARDKLAAWDGRLRGANYGSGCPDGVDADFAAARMYGCNLLRIFFPAHEDEDSRAIGLDLPGAMTPDDLADLESTYFTSSRFERALEILDATVAAARRESLYVVLVPGDVPGSHGKGPPRWRLYRNFRWHRELAAFWTRIAKRYRDEPCVIGYDLLNEPGFEVTANLDVTDREALRAFWSSTVETPSDLNRIYRTVAAAVREVDPRTPLVLEPGLFGTPNGIDRLLPLDDPSVIYSVHHYDPWLFTTWRMNRSRWSYPGEAPASGSDDPESPGPLVTWNAERQQREFVQPVEDWRRQHGIGANRIFLGEFGCDRRVTGAVAWLTDVVTTVEAAGWHWSFYAFRERVWGGMDYELGPAPESRTRGDASLLRPMIDAMTGRSGRARAERSR